MLPLVIVLPLAGKVNNVVVSGTFDLPGQQTFYLEPNQALAVPSTDADGERRLLVHSSTQSPTHTAQLISRATAVPLSHLDVHVGSVGGGFGGKQNRASPIAAMAALAALKVDRPVLFALNRPDDMRICPGRGAGRVNYKVRRGVEGYG